MSSGLLVGAFRAISHCRCARDQFSRAALSSRSQIANYANAAVDDNAASTSASSSGTQLPGSKDLGPGSVGSYYSLDVGLLPEASRAYAGAFYAPRDAGHERRGGCKALQQEAEVTGSHSVMYRPAMHALFEAVRSRSHPRVLLTGGPGVGKSIALVSLVEWARQQGWLVLYVPSATSLVMGGYFAPRLGPGGEEAGWDTLTSAQQLLKGMLDAHRQQLAGLPLVRPQPVVQPAAGGEADVGGAGGAGLQGEGAAAGGAARVGGGSRGGGGGGSGGGGGGSLVDVMVAAQGKEAQADQAVDACLALAASLASASRAGTRVLFALDDYNALHGASDFGTLRGSPQRGRRRVLAAGELNLARGLRLLESGEGELGEAVVVAATTSSPPLPAPQSLYPPSHVAELQVPGYSQVEVANALAHYHAAGAAGSPPSRRHAAHLAALCGGSGRELRTAAARLRLLGTVGGIAG